MKKLNHYFLLAYSFVITVVFVWFTISYSTQKNVTSANFEQITAKQIRIVEPDGTLRMVLSNHDQFPGIFVKGKEKTFDRPQAGMLFFNDEGSENGGLIFSGYTDAEGNIKNAGGSLTFDRYGGNQELQLMGVNDSDYAFTGLIIRDSPPGKPGYRRLWLGKDKEGTSSIALQDKKGNNRILIEVNADGAAQIVFLNEKGEVQKKISPTN